MFVRRSNLLIGAMITLFVGSACHDEDDCFCGTANNIFRAEARGGWVVPPTTDTTPRAMATFNTASLAYTYDVTTPPAGTIDSIALYEVDSKDPLPPSATAILCAGVAACASTSGTATVVPPATAATINTSMRAYRAQLVFFTTLAQKAAGGAMRGTPYPTPED